MSLRFFGIAVAGLLSVSSCSGNDDSIGGDREAARSREAEVLVAARDLVGALQQERTAALGSLVANEVWTLPDMSNEAARELLDVAQSSFERVLSGLSRRSEEYDAALVDLDGITLLRADVDGGVVARDSETSFSDAERIAERYGSLVVRMLDSTDLYVDVFEGSALEPAASLFNLGMVQTELRMTLINEVLFRSSDADTGNDPGGELLDIRGEILSGQSAARELAAGSVYGDEVDEVVAEVEASGFLEAVRVEAMSGQIDASEILISMAVPADGGWPGFLDSLGDDLREDG